ncbi:hypothetical protein F2P81_015190 [Scophthalmus maximus]|uniref:Uncharacterized protein n=1 Tax=Scophthalmus maximus TaxID=52904 RepID=A0A6A4SLY4_SCOMX|nr:hypothetical protein F2P81_015190 [Scophthalmus maximus]
MLWKEQRLQCKEYVRLNGAGFARSVVPGPSRALRLLDAVQPSPLRNQREELIKTHLSQIRCILFLLLLIVSGTPGPLEWQLTCELTSRDNLGKWLVRAPEQHFEGRSNRQTNRRTEISARKNIQTHDVNVVRHIDP